VQAVGIMDDAYDTRVPESIGQRLRQGLQILRVGRPAEVGCAVSVQATDLLLPLQTVAFARSAELFDSLLLDSTQSHARTVCRSTRLFIVLHFTLSWLQHPACSKENRKTARIWEGAS
jgi:hypothetical protein